jgi:hypothetical protein
MFKRLTDEVWYGNAESPFETIGQVKAILNVAHRFRSGYFERLGTIPYEVMYVRLAKKDREDVDQPYLSALAWLAKYVKDTMKLPILCHCRMGGHRGPSSALAIAYFLSGNLEALHERLLVLSPGLVRGRNYYRSILELLRRHDATQRSNISPVAQS